MIGTGAIEVTEEKGESGDARDRLTTGLGGRAVRLNRIHTPPAATTVPESVRIATPAAEMIEIGIETVVTAGVATPMTDHLDVTFLRTDLGVVVAKIVTVAIEESEEEVLHLRGPRNLPRT